MSSAGYFAHVRSIVEFPGDDDAFVRGWNALSWGKVRDVVDILPGLKSRAPVYMSTKSNRTHEIFLRTAYSKTLNLFIDLFVSSRLGQRRPERSALDAVAAKTGFGLTSMLFYDDTIENVEAARTAGLRAVHVTEPSDVGRELACKPA